MLVAFGKEKTLFCTTVLGAISNVIMNIALIPVLQQNGAAIASVLSELAVCIYQYIAAHKQINTEFDKRDLYKMIIATTVMAVIVHIIAYIVSNTFIAIVFSCLVGVGVYFIVTFLLHVKTSILILKSIRSVLKI